MPEESVSRRQPRHHHRRSRAARPARKIVLPWQSRRPPLLFSVGLFFLTILGASFTFQVLQPLSRIIYIFSMIIGFGITAFKTGDLYWSSSVDRGDSLQSSFPNWLAVLVVVPFLMIVAVVIFGWNFLIGYFLELFIDQDGWGQFLALVLGIGLGVIIELSLANLLRAIKHLRSSIR